MDFESLTPSDVLKSPDLLLAVSRFIVRGPVTDARKLLKHLSSQLYSRAQESLPSSVSQNSSAVLQSPALALQQRPPPVEVAAKKFLQQKYSGTEIIRRLTKISTQLLINGLKPNNVWGAKEPVFGETGDIIERLENARGNITDTQKSNACADRLWHLFMYHRIDEMASEICAKKVPKKTAISKAIAAYARKARRSRELVNLDRSYARNFLTLLEVSGPGDLVHLDPGNATIWKKELSTAQLELILEFRRTNFPRHVEESKKLNAAGAEIIVDGLMKAGWECAKLAQCHGKFMQALFTHISREKLAEGLVELKDNCSLNIPHEARNPMRESRLNTPLDGSNSQLLNQQERVRQNRRYEAGTGVLWEADPSSIDASTHANSTVQNGLEMLTTVASNLDATSTVRAANSDNAGTLYTLDAGGPKYPIEDSPPLPASPNQATARPGVLPSENDNGENVINYVSAQQMNAEPTEVESMGDMGCQRAAGNRSEGIEGTTDAPNVAPPGQSIDERDGNTNERFRSVEEPDEVNIPISIPDIHIVGEHEVDRDMLLVTGESSSSDGSTENADSDPVFDDPGPEHSIHTDTESFDSYEQSPTSITSDVSIIPAGEPIQSKGSSGRLASSEFGLHALASVADAARKRPYAATQDVQNGGSVKHSRRRIEQEDGGESSRLLSSSSDEWSAKPTEEYTVFNQGQYSKPYLEECISEEAFPNDEDWLSENSPIQPNVPFSHTPPMTDDIPPLFPDLFSDHDRADQ